MKMKHVDPSIYDKNYYLNVCLGSAEYKKSKGNKLNKKWIEMLNLVKLKPGMRVLDLGCGRGDLAFYLAKRRISVVGIDYSKAAIELANFSLRRMPYEVKKLVKFMLMDANKLNFQDNYFDLVIAIDVFEHLYKEELDLVMQKISKELKKDGILLVHTETNKIYLDFTHNFFVYPISSFLIKINNHFLKKSYQGLHQDPRNEYHKLQHVNEPTIFYLKKIFSKFFFKGRIISSVGILKPIITWKDYLYNFFVCLYPLSSFFPLNILFATDYICIVKNNKK